MKASGLRPDTISYTCAVGALGRAREWEKALAVWTTMLSEGVAPDGLALHTLLRALAGAGQWQTAVGVFEAILASDDADVCTTPVFCAALEACAVGGAPSKARGYMREMGARAIAPSAACYAQLAAAHAAAADWRGALEVWKGMVHQGVQPDAATYKSVYEALEAAGATEEAKAVMEYAERQGVPLMFTATREVV